MNTNKTEAGEQTHNMYEVITSILMEHFGLQCLPMQATRFACDKYTALRDASQAASDALLECLCEIYRLNKAAGETVFNPTATSMAKVALSAISQARGELATVRQEDEDEPQEPDHDDTVHCCPDCEQPNQFGELCPSCRTDRQDEIDAGNHELALD